MVAASVLVACGDEGPPQQPQSWTEPTLDAIQTTNLKLPPPATAMELRALAASEAAQQELQGLTVERINASLDEATAYLTRVTLPDGEFIYEYNPVTGESGVGYNILRHAGTTYSMLQYYEHTKDANALEKAKLAITYLMQFVQPLQLGGQTVACIVHDDAVKLGGNGLALVALAKYTQVTGDKQHLPVMQQLAGYIAATQDPTGNFTVHNMTWSTQQVSASRSLYYPGEAILALTRLHAIDGDEHWLDVAEAGARWLAEIRDVAESDKNISHDHWMMIATDELYRQRPRKSLLDHTMRLARVICVDQIRQSSDVSYIGGWYYPPRVNPTSCRTEGLAAAWRLARDFDRADQMPMIQSAILMGVTFQMRMQYVDQRLLDMKAPDIARGGFPEGFLNPRIRIDTVQHNISSLLAAIDIVKAANQ